MKLFTESEYLDLQSHSMYSFDKEKICINKGKKHWKALAYPSASLHDIKLFSVFYNLRIKNKLYVKFI